MDDIGTTLAAKAQPRTRLSAEEIARRREIVRQADANNRIEGIVRDRESDAVFEAFVRGDIEVTDIVPHLKAQAAIP